MKSWFPLYLLDSGITGANEATAYLKIATGGGEDGGSNQYSNIMQFEVMDMVITPI